MTHSQPAYAWRYLALLFTINLLNFFDRTIPAVLAEPIRKEWGLGDTHLGMLAMSFTLVYAIMGVPLGRLSDLWVRKYVLSAGVAVWSAMTAASALAGSFLSFFLIRLGVGVGEASCAPAAISLLGDLFPASKRARAMGIFMLGLPLGIFLCNVLIGGLARAMESWRAPFVIAALPGIVIAGLVLLLKEPQRGAQEGVAAAASTPVEKPFRLLMSIPTLWYIIASGAFVNFASYSMSTFLPALLMRYHHLDVGKAGAVAGISLGLVGVAGLLVGGWAADRMYHWRANGRLLLAAWSMLVATPLIGLALWQPVGEITLLTLFLALGWMLVYVYYVTVYTALSEVVEPGLRATAMSLYFFAMYVCGAAFGAMVVGGLSDRLAAAAMQAAGQTQMTEALRAIGLHQAMYVVPVMILLTALSLFGAAKRFEADRDGMLRRLVARA